MYPHLAVLQDILTRAAKEELLPRFSHVERRRKADGSIVTEADTSMQARVEEALRNRWPEIPLLGEEMSAAAQQAQLEQSTGGLWVLDPLDGTSNFASGIPYFCVSLALVRDAGVELGIVYDPLRDELFCAALGRGAWLNGVPLRVPPTPLPMQEAMGLVDFKRLPPGISSRLACEPPYLSQRSFGSGALDWCMIAAGRCQLYLHGGQRLWDYAAGQLILAEAGGSSSTLEGGGVFTPSLAPRPVVAATSHGLQQQWLGWLTGAGKT